MKLLIYTVNYAPETVGIGKYSGEMAEWLARMGHEVRVVAAPPYYPAWKVSDDYRGMLYRCEHRNGVSVWRAPLWVPSKPNGATRVLHLLTFAISSLPLMFRQMLWRPDVVFTVAPAFVCAPAGWLTARLCGAKSWLHVQDFEIDVAFRLGLLKGRRLRSVVEAAERWILRRFDRLSSISRGMLKRAESKGVDPDNLLYFPNWVDVGNIKPLSAPSSYRAELGVSPDAVVALYSGSFGGKYGLMMLPEAARRLAHFDDLVFVICGDGALKEELRAKCEGLRNVRLLPLQPVERLGELLGLADIHLLPQGSSAEDLVMPSKLSGIFASGRATVATCQPESELARVLRGCGLAIPCEDIDALTDAIESLRKAPETRAQMGAGGRHYAEVHLATDAVLGRFNMDLAVLLERDAAPTSAAEPDGTAD